jgi:lipopolysaccharide export system permease protein
MPVGVIAIAQQLLQNPVRFKDIPVFRFRILDRYIFKDFLKSFFFIVLMLTLVICMIDVVEKNDDFIKTKPGLYRILFVYYGNYIPYIANMLSPITVFIATVFMTSRLAARTEIIAMLSSGISFIRLLVPYIAGSGLIGMGTYFLIGYTIPEANKKRIAFELAYIKNPFHFDGRNTHIKISPLSYFYIQSYNNETKEGSFCTLENVKGTQLLKKLKADRFIWQETSQRWRLENVQVFDFTRLPMPFVRIPRLDTVLPLRPKDFESQYMKYETLNNRELGNYLRELKSRGADNTESYEVEQYLRITYPFSVIILTLIGVILSARKSREGAGFQIALGFVLAFVYIIFYITSRTIAQAGSLDPLLACWLPNLVFAVIGLVLYKSVPK